LRTLLTINVPISAFFGTSCIIVPNGLISLYGVELNEPGVFMTQLAGAAFLGFGVLAFLARSTDSKEFRLAVALALFVRDSIGTVVSVYGQITGLFNALGWTTVAVYLFLAFGYGYFRFLKTEES
jgi:hypothetical protein